MNKGGESYKLYDREVEGEDKFLFRFFFIFLTGVRLSLLDTVATIGL
jgi:hypothetical protein